jgi:hypothetical protein
METEAVRVRTPRFSVQTSANETKNESGGQQLVDRRR